MKANEAPKKIYFGECDKSILDIYSTKESDNEIEYTRTDAFIEAVADWMYDNLQTVVGVNHPFAHHVESLPVLSIITQTEFVEKFKKEIMSLID